MSSNENGLAEVLYRVQRARGVPQGVPAAQEPPLLRNSTARETSSV